jgi:hypothetical protein
LRNPGGYTFRPPLDNRAKNHRQLHRQPEGRRCCGSIVLWDSALAYLAAGRIALDSIERFDENSICRTYSMTKLLIVYDFGDEVPPPPNGYPAINRTRYSIVLKSGERLTINYEEGHWYLKVRRMVCRTNLDLLKTRVMAPPDLQQGAANEPGNS